MIPDRVRGHAEVFNTALRSGDFDPLRATFTGNAGGTLRTCLRWSDVDGVSA